MAAKKSKKMPLTKENKRARWGEDADTMAREKAAAAAKKKKAKGK